MMYLKKRKMVEIARKVLSLDALKGTDCWYRFRNGFEWLEFCTNEHYYELCSFSTGKYMSLTTYDCGGLVINSVRFDLSQASTVSLSKTNCLDI